MGVCANAREVITRMGELRQLGWLAAAWLAACVSTSIPEPAHGSPLSPHAEAAPVMPVATSLTHDPLATLPAPAHHDHQHPLEHAEAEQPAADGGGMADAHAPPAAPAKPSPAHGQRAAAPADPSSDVYVCPMHPDVRQSTPGNCPRCGMKLVPAPKTTPKDPKPQPHEHHGE